MECIVQVPRGPGRVAVVGTAERNLKMIREALGVKVAARDDTVRLEGEPGAVSVARRVLDRIHRESRERRALSRQHVLELISDEAARPGMKPGEPDATGPERWDGHLDVYAGGRPVRPKTPNQQHYLDAIRDHDLIFGIGPAGTGKTYLAVATAVHLLKAGVMNKVILARPAVEAGERLGFLPGDISDKVNPYLRPLLDALHDMMDFATLRRFIDNDVIEVSPLAFMRGRTLNNAVILLDEAQNTTRIQMQMFLTRMGHGSKVIVTGDTTQIDLPEPAQSGLIDAARRLRRVPGAAFVTLDREDVVRHGLVQRVIEAYGDEASRRHKADVMAALDDHRRDGAEGG